MTIATKTQIPLVDLKAQYATIKDEVLPAIEEVLEGMQLTIGPNVKAFDEEFAKFCGTKHAIGVGSGTDALRFALINGATPGLDQRFGSAKLDTRLTSESARTSSSGA